MEILKSLLSPQNSMGKNGLEWIRNYMKLGFLGTRDVASMMLGVISVTSWSVAEIPQIISNYNQKSTEGLSLAFLFTWILGDLMNIFGCLLEPTTLPTQFYVAISYAFTSSILAAQSIYYGYFYKPVKSDQLHNEVISIEAEENTRKENYALNKKDVLKVGFLPSMSASTPIPLPAQAASSRGELYCRSARYLSMSHTPSARSYIVQRVTSENDLYSTKVPLLDRHAASTMSAPSPGIRPMLCVAFYLTFFIGIFNFQKSETTGVVKLFQAPVSVEKKVGRKLLQANGVSVRNTSSLNTDGIGSFLGWGMTAIYLGGRLPQILLNIRRGNVEGLNPLMFLFALLGNITYVGSILINSMAWTKLRPNLPWLVDAGGCVLLDTFIVIQFIYFRFWVLQTGEIMRT